MLASGSHLWDPESAPMQQQQTISQLRFLPVEATDLEHLAQLEQDLFEDPWSVEMMRTELNNGMVTAVKALDHADRLLGYYSSRSLRKRLNFIILLLYLICRGRDSEDICCCMP